MTDTKKEGSISDHLANERTLLAWIRTSIGIMAFGFVVVKFSLFVRQITLMLNEEAAGIHPIDSSDHVGIVLVALGALTLVLAYIRYKRIEKRLASGTYHPSSLLLTIITGCIFVVSILLIIYLAKNII